MLLETYSSLPVEELKKGLPPFLRDVEDVTGKPEYSMFNLSLRDESYDAKFYKYAPAHGKQQPPTSLSPLNGHNNHRHQNGRCQMEGQSNGTASPTPSVSPSVSPSSDDILIALTSSAIKRAQIGSPGSGECSPNGGLSGSSNGSYSNGANKSNGGGDRTTSNGNGHLHLE